MRGTPHSPETGRRRHLVEFLAIGTVAVMGAGVQVANADDLLPIYIQTNDISKPSPKTEPEQPPVNDRPVQPESEDHIIAVRVKDRSPKFKHRIPRFIIPGANAAGGYIIANAIDDDMIVMSESKEKDHHKRNWVLSYLVHTGQEHDNECAWFDRAAVIRARSRIKLRFKPNICADQKSRLADRDSIGKDFNCGEHVCDDGTFGTELREKCKSQPKPLNYGKKAGKSYDELPPLRMIGGFHYRYTTRDGKKAVGRVMVRLPRGSRTITDSLWVTLPESCLIGNRKGGPKLDYGHHVQSTA